MAGGKKRVATARKPSAPRRSNATSGRGTSRRATSGDDATPTVDEPSTIEDATTIAEELREGVTTAAVPTTRRQSARIRGQQPASATNLHTARRVRSSTVIQRGAQDEEREDTSLTRTTDARVDEERTTTNDGDDQQQTTQANVRAKTSDGQTARSARKRPSDAVYVATTTTKTTQQPRWPSQQVDLWMEMSAQAKDEEWSQAETLRRFNEVSRLRNWPERELEACRAQKRRKIGADSGYRWTPEQIQFLVTMKAEGRSNTDIYEQYKAHAKDHGWKEREYKAVMFKLARVSDEDLEQRSQSSVGAGEDSPGANLTSGKAYWDDREDELLRTMIKRARAQRLKLDFRKCQQELRLLQQRLGMTTSYRSIGAISTRVYLLKSGQTSTNRQWKKWSAEDDAAILASQRNKKKKSECIMDLAQKLHTSTYFINLRWRALLNLHPDIEETVDSDDGDEVEEENLRHSPPREVNLEPRDAVEESEHEHDTGDEAQADDDEHRDDGDDQDEPRPPMEDSYTAPEQHREVKKGGRTSATLPTRKSDEEDGGVLIDESRQEDSTTNGAEESDMEVTSLASAEHHEVTSLAPTSSDQALVQPTHVHPTINQVEENTRDSDATNVETKEEEELRMTVQNQMVIDTPERMSQDKEDMDESGEAQGSQQNDTSTAGEGSDRAVARNEILTERKEAANEQTTEVVDMDEEDDHAFARMTPDIDNEYEEDKQREFIQTMTRLRIPVWSKAGYVPVTADTVCDINAHVLRGDSSLKAMYTAFEDDAKRDPNGAYTQWEGRREVRLPPEWIRELAFGITLILRNNEALAMFLRELWTRDYGECRDQVCCLTYDINSPRYNHYGPCRHWEYWRFRQVHLDRFTHSGDYRLALALAVHLEALKATSDSRIPHPTQCPVMMSIKLASVSRGDRLRKKWSTWKEALHLKPLFGTITCAYVSRSLLTFEALQVNGLQSWEYGRLMIQEGTSFTILGEAILFNYDTWFFLTTATCKALSDNWDKLIWAPQVSVLNLARRFAAIDRMEPMPFLQELSERRVNEEPHKDAEKVLERLENSQTWQSYKHRLDNYQLKVVEHFVTRRGIRLTRGPYGAGKTTTVTACVVAFTITHPGSRIAIVSETNAAINEDLRRLLRDGTVYPEEIIRLGDMDPDMEPYKQNFMRTHLDELRKKLIEERVSRAERNRQLDAKEQELLRSRQVILSTLSQLARECYRRVDYHAVINDEGAQTLESALMQCIRPSVHTLESIGDENQLHGYTSLFEKEREQYENGTRRHKLTWSLTHAVAYAHQKTTGTSKFPGITVKSQYRSHARITQWLQAFYTYTMKPKAQHSTDYLSNMTLPITTAGLNKVGEERIFWIDCSNEGRCKDGSDLTGQSEKLYNTVEVAVCMELVLRIRAVRARRYRGPKPPPRKRVFIITPYRDQVALLTKEFARCAWIFEYWVDVTIATTDSSQAREADIVIASMVRYRHLGFMRGYPARSLVSLSRCRDYLFVLASKKVYAQDDTWKTLLERAQAMAIPLLDSPWTAPEAADVLKDEQQLKLVAEYQAPSP